MQRVVSRLPCGSSEVCMMRGDESQTGVRGGVTQITPTDGQREGSKVSDLCLCVCVCLCVKMIYPENEYKRNVHVCVCLCGSMSGRVKQEAVTWRSTDMSFHQRSPSWFSNGQREQNNGAEAHSFHSDASWSMNTWFCAAEYQSCSICLINVILNCYSKLAAAGITKRKVDLKNPGAACVCRTMFPSVFFFFLCGISKLWQPQTLCIANKAWHWNNLITLKNSLNSVWSA